MLVNSVICIFLLSVPFTKSDVRQLSYAIRIAFDDRLSIAYVSTYFQSGTDHGRRSNQLDSSQAGIDSTTTV